MQFSDYQRDSRTTAKYPNAGRNFIYPTLGLMGEAGEIAEKVKKLIRDQQIETPDLVSAEDKDLIKKELGDVLWYLSQLATEFGFDLAEVAEANLEKLRFRLERNQLHGSGDNR